MPGQTIATAYVDIVARLDKFESDLKRVSVPFGEINDAADRAFKGLTGDAQRATEAIQDDFRETQRVADDQLKQIGGADVWGDIKSDAARTGESIEDSMKEAAKTSNSKLDDISTKGGAGFGKMAGLVGGAIAGIGIAQFGIDSVKAAGDAAKGVSQLEQVLKTTGGAAGLTSQQLQDAASHMSMKIGVDDDEIISAQTKMLTFKNVTGDTFNTAMSLAGDMSAVFGQDLSASSVQLGKALNDPTKGIAALGRVGVTFTEQQKAQIKAMQKSGDLAGAQAIVMKELKSEVGGAAEASATGAQKMNVAFGELQESLGGGLADAINAIAPSIVKVFSLLQGPMEAIGGGLGKVLTSVFTALEPVLPPLTDALTLVADVIGGVLADAATALAPTIKVLAGVFAQIVGVAGKILTPIVKSLGQVFQVLAPIIAQVATFVGNILMAALNALAPILPIIVDALAQVATVIGGALNQVLLAILPPLGNLITQLVTALAPMLPSLISLFLTLVDAIMPLLPPLTQLIITVLPPLIDLLTAILIPLAKLLTKVQAVFTGIQKVIYGVVGAVIKTVVGLMTNLSGTWNRITAIARNVWNAIANFFSSIWGRIRAVFQNAVNLVNGVVSRFLTYVRTIIVNAWNGIVTFFAGLPGRMARAISTLASAVAAQISAMYTRARTAITTFVSNAATWIGALPGRMASAISGLAGAIIGKFNDVRTRVSSFISGFINDAARWIGALPSRLASAISGLAGSIYDGIRGAVRDAWNRVVNLIPAIDWDLPGPIPGSIKIDVRGLLRWNAMGDVFDRPSIIGVGERGSEAVIPLTRPRRAMQLMNQTGLTQLVLAQRNGPGGGPLITMPGAIIQSPSDADLVAQRTMAALAMRGVA